MRLVDRRAIGHNALRWLLVHPVSVYHVKWHLRDELFETMSQPYGEIVHNLCAMIRLADAK